MKLSTKLLISIAAIALIGSIILTVYFVDKLPDKIDRAEMTTNPDGTKTVTTKKWHRVGGAYIYESNTTTVTNTETIIINK